MPTITNLAPQMTSTEDRNPVVEVVFTLTTQIQNTPCSIAPSGFQYALASSPGQWVDAQLYPEISPSGIIGRTAGVSRTLLWDVKSQLPDMVETPVLMRLVLKDDVNVESEPAVSSEFNIKTSNPTVSLDFEDYVNSPEMTLPIQASQDVAWYRASENSDMTDALWVQYSGTASYEFESPDDGEKAVYVQVADQYFNTSQYPYCSDSIMLHQTPPANAFLRINGTIAGNHTFTGIVIDPYTGVFTPDRTVRLDMYAEDLYPMEIYIDGNMEDSADVRSWIPYKISSTVTLATSPSGTDFGYDANRTVNVMFRDIAGNTTTASRTIRLNNRIFKTAHKPMRPSSSEYTHQVYEVNNAGSQLLVIESVSLESTFVRKWSEIFYPTNHDYPRNPDGTIDETACKNLTGSNANYDTVRVDTVNGVKSVYYDDEGRPVTNGWSLENKDYGNMESSYWLPPDPEDEDGVGDGLRYWIIDNTGYGDMTLEFEHFHLNPNSFGLPLNRMTPHVGDVLTIYNADADGAVVERLGPTGDTTYLLDDATKLVELYSFTGDGSQVVDLVSGYSMNADANGSFTVPEMKGVNRVCLVLYTDAGGVASGFKLKAGPRHSTVFTNYHVDENNGELWLHKYSNGQSTTQPVRMIYDYYDAEATVDLDEGTVSFAINPSGRVFADYTHYVKPEDMITGDLSRQFISFDDDYVDYLEPSLYVKPSGQLLNKSSIYEFGYPDSPHPSGVVLANFSVDKDRGVVEFADGTADYGDEFAYVPPSGRILMDYFHHTFKRLSNDGYGTLNFRDNTIVADNTPIYPDFTFTDIKFVNEGDAILENGKMEFVSRGYDDDNNDVIDQVLDVNRPWDTQKGTAAETYDRVAMQPSQTYSFNLRPTQAEARTILSTYKGSSFLFLCPSRSRWFGRVVWSLGPDYPDTTTGKKCFSSTISGNFYNLTL